MKLIFGIGALAFLSLLLFGGGVFLHGASPQPVQSAAEAGKVAAHAHGKSKPAVKAVPLSAANAENPQAFPLTVGGGLGLLVSALAALALSHSLRVPTPEAARRMRDAK